MNLYHADEDNSLSTLVLPMRYKVWRSRKDNSLHLLCGGEGEAAFDALPNAIRHLGPWSGGAEGEVDRLRLPYRLMLASE
jgi:hypothetical protein